MRPLLIAIGIGALLLLAPVGAAQDTLTVHRTYEFGPYGDRGIIQCVPYIDDVSEDCDPTDLTQDDSIDIGGVGFPDEITQDFTHAQASVVDDLFGANTVGFWLCSRLQSGQSNGWCDDEGETLAQACGSSPTVALPTEPYDGLIVFLNGFIFQALDCDSTQAPTSTTGGVLDPAGGIFVTLTA